MIGSSNLWISKYFKFGECNNMPNKMTNGRVNNLEEVPQQLWAIFISDDPNKWRHILSYAFKVPDDQQGNTFLHLKHKVINSDVASDIREYRDYDFIIIIHEGKDKICLKATLNYFDIKSSKPKVYKVIREYNRPSVITTAKIASHVTRFAEFGISNALAWSQRDKE